MYLILFQYNLLYSTGSALGGAIGIIIMFSVFPHSSIFKNRIALKGLSGKEYRGTAVSRKEEDLLGFTGVTVTVLRPSGNAKINGKRYQVQSDGEHIDKGEKIKVTNVDANRIIVKKVEEV